MNELHKLFENLKLNKKTLALIVLAIFAVILSVLCELFGGDVSEQKINATDTANFSAEYIKKTEAELEKILEEIDGTGDVRVMLTLESCYENIYAKAYETDSDLSEKSSGESVREEYVIIKNSGNEECLVVKVYEPVIKGVAVVCEGGDSTNVKKAVTEVVCALFDISTAKVSVTKMNSR